MAVDRHEVIIKASLRAAATRANNQLHTQYTRKADIVVVISVILASLLSHDVNAWLQSTNTDVSLKSTL